MHLLIADDHTLFRDALVEFFRRAEGDSRIDVACSLPDAMDRLAQTGPVDLVLLDLRMPGMAGPQGAASGVAQMRAAHPDQKVAILSGTAEEADVSHALRTGAAAYFPKTMSGAALLGAIRLVIAGERFVPLAGHGVEVMPSHYADPDAARGVKPAKQVDDAQLALLTPREREVLAHLGRGASNKDIALALNLQPATIKLHVAGVCRKLNVKNRTQAALIAQNAGMA